MTIFQAFILGLVQGLGEFLPISSSAHLVLVPWLFRWADPGLTFDIALHVGTLIAVVLYFWKDWLNLISKGLTKPKEREGKLFWFLVLATIPGASIGYLLEHKAETVFRNPLLIAVMLILMGAILYWADRQGKKQINVEHISLKTSFLIGLSQALAIIPGVSRSGVTMTTALALGMTRESAARFSFMLSTPVIAGAGILQILRLAKAVLHPAESMPPVNWSAMGVGFLCAAISGFLCIRFFLRYIQTKSFTPFVVYRFLLAGLVLVYYLKS